MSPAGLEKKLIEPGYHHRVYETGDDPKLLYDNTKSEAYVFTTMGARQRLSVVQIDAGVSSVRGVQHGLGDTLAQAAALKRPGLLSPGGYYVHYPHLFRSDTKGRPLYGENYKFAVGECSTTTECLPVATAYSDLLSQVAMTDGSYVTVGPRLNNALDIPPPENIPHTKFHTTEARFCYFVQHVKAPWNLDGVLPEYLEQVYEDMRKLPKDHDGMPIDRDGNPGQVPNVVFHSGHRFDAAYGEKLELGSLTSMSLVGEEKQLKLARKKPTQIGDGQYKYAANEPQHQNVKTPFALLPGSCAHNGQPNERQAYAASPDGRLFSYSLTCKRADGATINEFRSMILADLVSHGYKRTEVIATWTIVNLDGGPNTLQLYRGSEGKLTLLAKGGLEGKPLPAKVTDAIYRLGKSWTVLRTRDDGIPAEADERILGNNGVGSARKELVHTYPEEDKDAADFFAESEAQKAEREQARKTWWGISTANAARQNESESE